MRILLAGASGVLGQRAVRELTAASHEVAGLGAARPTRYG